ncbi:MAG TPA: sensor histidine kinase [Gaiellaceae bacterium]|nr:sensor histidine kinase [Gaiellaceae bacterium]
MRALLAGQELERKRLARELHDETAQALTSILLGLKGLEGRVGEEPLAVIRGLVGSALGDVRRLAVELRPPALDDLGLGPALDRLATIVAEKSGLGIEVDVAFRGEQLTPEQETALYRIVQQALANVVNHADARSVSVVVCGRGGVVRAVIEDDGAGFDPADVREGALGVVGMRERVLLLGGRFEIDSSPGTGTTVVVELPTR